MSEFKIQFDFPLESPSQGSLKFPPGRRRFW